MGNHWRITIKVVELVLHPPFLEKGLLICLMEKPVEAHESLVTDSVKKLMVSPFSVKVIKQSGVIEVPSNYQSAPKALSQKVEKHVEKPKVFVLLQLHRRDVDTS